MEQQELNKNKLMFSARFAAQDSLYFNSNSSFHNEQ